MTDLPGAPLRADDLTRTTAGTTTGGAASPPIRPAGDLNRGQEKSSTTDVDKNEAANVKDTAVSAGQNVAATARTEAANVLQETQHQARGLLDNVNAELRSQAGSQQQRIAAAVHSLSRELGGMASGSDQSGPLTDLAHEASRRGGEIAHWLENREPKDVLEEVKSFGRRRPVAFLSLCVLAGVVAGRLTRNAVAANTSLDSPNPSPGAKLGTSVDTGTDRSIPGPTSPPNRVSTYDSGPPVTAPSAAGGYPPAPGQTSFPDPVTTWTDQPAGAAINDPFADPLSTPLAQPTRQPLGQPVNDRLTRPDDTR